MLKNLGCFLLLRALLKYVNFALLLTDFSQLENKCLILFFKATVTSSGWLLETSFAAPVSFTTMY